MKEYTAIPELDHAEPDVTANVADIVRRVQRQGDPQLIMRLDAMVNMDTDLERFECFQAALENITWKEI